MREPRAGDFSASAAMWAHREVARFIGGSPSTPEQSWSRLLRYVGHWTAFGFGYWTVEELASGAVIGEVGFGYHRREIAPAVDIPELGWVLHPSAHGKGYATEAARAAIAWAQRHLTATQAIACIIAPENLASIRVAEKCGFTLRCETSYKGLPTLLYERALTR